MDEIFYDSLENIPGNTQTNQNVNNAFIWRPWRDIDVSHTLIVVRLSTEKEVAFHLAGFYTVY